MTPASDESLARWAASQMPSHADRFRVGDRVRVARLYAHGYPRAWLGLGGTVTQVLGEVPTYRVHLDGAEEHDGRERAVFLRAELEHAT